MLLLACVATHKKREKNMIFVTKVDYFGNMLIFDFCNILREYCANAKILTSHMVCRGNETFFHLQSQIIAIFPVISTMQMIGALDLFIFSSAFAESWIQHQALEALANLPAEKDPTFDDPTLELKSDLSSEFNLDPAKWKDRGSIEADDLEQTFKLF